MKCEWCEGFLRPIYNEIGDMDGYRCLHCGRGEDFKHELRVKMEQLKPHHNWHGDIEDPEMKNNFTPRKTGWDKRLGVEKNR
jgi:hypothetical protein